jgi:hypothetical protein
MSADALERALTQIVALRSVMDETLAQLRRLRAGGELSDLQTERLSDIEETLTLAATGPMCQVCGCSAYLECEGGCYGHDTGRCSRCPAPDFEPLTPAQLAEIQGMPTALAVRPQRVNLVVLDGGKHG